MIILSENNVNLYKKHVTKINNFLHTYQWITDAYVSDFFFKEHWKNLPVHWQNSLSKFSTDQLANLLTDEPLRTCEVVPLSLLSFRACTQAFSLSRQCSHEDQVQSAVQHVTGTPCILDGNKTCLKPTDANGQLHAFFRKHVKPKKQHEIKNLAKVINGLADGIHCDHVVDVGSGLGHLARLLAFGFGLQVTSIEATDTHAPKAAKYDGEIDREIRKKFESSGEKCHPPRHVTSRIYAHMTTEDFMAVINSDQHAGDNIDDTEPPLPAIRLTSTETLMLDKKQPAIGERNSIQNSSDIQMVQSSQVKENATVEFTNKLGFDTDTYSEVGSTSRGYCISSEDTGRYTGDDIETVRDNGIEMDTLQQLCNGKPCKYVNTTLSKSKVDEESCCSLSVHCNGYKTSATHKTDEESGNGSCICSVKRLSGEYQTSEQGCKRSRLDDSCPATVTKQTCDEDHQHYKSKKEKEGKIKISNNNQNLVQKSTYLDHNSSVSSQICVNVEKILNQNNVDGVQKSWIGDCANNSNIETENTLQSSEKQDLSQQECPSSGHAPCQRTGFLLTGLHACGDLTPTFLRFFVNCKMAVGLASVGCCYMKLSEQRSGDLDVGYPMSRHVSGLLHNRLTYEARELACHFADTYYKRLKEGSPHLKIHSYRAALEWLANQLVSDFQRSSVQIPAKKTNAMNFESYALLGLEKLGVPTTDLTADLLQQAVEMTGRWRDVVAFYTVRLALAPVVETLILLDRMIYLHEQSYRSALVPIFDPEVSPRNFVLLACKTTRE